MGTVTAKQLRQKTGELLTITCLGKPVAIMALPTDDKFEVLQELRSEGSISEADHSQSIAMRGDFDSAF
jgi:hypothetical protein